MSSDEWRALIEAYLEGRLSAATFAKRFTEAFDVVARTRQPVHARIQDLFFVVEAYGGDPMGRGHDVTDDQDLRAAAAAALAALPASLHEAEAAPPSGAAEPLPEPQPADVLEPAWQGERRREDVRRAAFTLGAVGAAGCLAILAWAAVGVLQFFAASAQIDSVLQLGPAPSAIIGLVVAFTPILGSVVAFFGAKDVWHWPIWAAGLVFLVAPALTLLNGADRWRRWRRR